MRPVALLFVFLLAVVAFGADSEAVATRAARAYAAGEWASAQALYGIVTESDPASAAATARLIVSAEQRADSTAAAPALERYMSAGAPLEPLLDEVEELCFNLGRADMYEALLHRLAQQTAYLRRPLALRLLKFYIFRGNPSATIEYARLLLRGLPGDPQYLNAMGKAYMMLGDTAEALRCYGESLHSDPDNLDALLALGNYYGTLDDAARALPYLRHAQELAPTPFLADEIERLQNLN